MTAVDRVSPNGTIYRDLEWSQGESAHGHSTIYVTCPWCGEESEVYVWSFHGGGKRCHCGAKMFPWAATKPPKGDPKENPSP